MAEKKEAHHRAKLTGENVGPGDQTVAELFNPGTAFLDYYAQTGPVTFNVVFFATGNASAVVQVDFGPAVPLGQGVTQLTFNQVLQLNVNLQSGTAKYGWIVVR